MTKEEMVKEISAKTGIKQWQVLEVVDELFSGIINAAKSGESVQIRGFGTFKARDKCNKEFSNPQTGGTSKTKPGKKLSFNPGKGAQWQK